MEINSGDTAWLLIATALVMVMLPGLALFYGGLVRRKNVLSTIMHSFFGLALVSVVWVLWGYTIAFGPDTGYGLVGGLDFLGFANVTGEVDDRYAATIPHVLFAAFQLMFAAITPALISGAFAERKRFAAFALFTVAWSTLVYSPLAHWVWAPGGWLRTMGALDYAGGTVVHISSGVSALVVALVIGRRVTNGDRLEPHDVPMTVLGAGLLWFGWFGFNAGSALAATGQAANALLVTNTAAGAATLTWVAASYLHKRKVSVVGAACGAVAGLVAITPASGFGPPAGRSSSASPWAGSATAPRCCASGCASTTPSTCGPSTASEARSGPWPPGSWPSRRSVESAARSRATSPRSAFSSWRLLRPGPSPASRPS